MCCPAIRTGRNIHQVEATFFQHPLESFLITSTPTTRPQWLTGERVVGEATVCLEQRPGKQATHVQLVYPGIFQQYRRQFESELRLRDTLRLVDEICFVLQCRDLFQSRHDSVECLLYAALIIEQPFVLTCIRQWMHHCHIMCSCSTPSTTRYCTGCCCGSCSCSGPATRRTATNPSSIPVVATFQHVRFNLVSTAR